MMCLRVPKCTTANKCCKNKVKPTILVFNPLSLHYSNYCIQRSFLRNYLLHNLSPDLSPEVEFWRQVIQPLHITTYFCIQVEEIVEDTSVLTELFYPQWSELSTGINIQLGLYVIVWGLPFFFKFSLNNH